MFSTRPLTVAVADVVFCHWPVDADALARSVPDWLTVETADGDAWVTAVAHTVTGVSAFGVTLTRPAEAVTVRTYVRGPDGQRGVRFVAVFTGERLAAALSGPALGLPYREGRPERRTPEGEPRRRTLDVDGRRALDVQYTPGDGDPTTAPPDSLPAFLVERHRYFTEGAAGTRLVGSVGHDPWPLGSVDATVSRGPLSALSLPEADGEPLVHYSPGTELGLAPPGPVWLDGPRSF